MRILGIDPGLSGGVALVNFDQERQNIVTGFLMPTQEVVAPKGKKRRSVDVYHLSRLIDAQQQEDIIHAAVIERVGAMPGQGVASTFNFGRAFGSVEGVVAANFIPIVYAAPAKWKKEMRLSKDKGASLKLASETFPTSNLFQLKKNDGIAEAALMAVWEFQNLQRERG